MGNPLKIVEVEVSDQRALEPLGTKTKWWVKDYTHLFKVNYEARREDCSEVVVANLCALLGLPHAKYQLGMVRIKDGDETWDEKYGVLTPSFYQRPAQRLVDGNQLLLSKDSSYPAENRYKVSEYTVDAVARVVTDLEMPPTSFCGSMPDSVHTALDVFIGYTMLDVLVANQDRHHENWGAIESGDRRMLTPTFDHGAALAPGESVDRMRKRLETRDQGFSVDNFARRAMSPFWDQPGGEQLSLYNAWREFSRYSPRASNAWLDRLGKLQLDSIYATFAELPEDRFPKVARAFCLKLVYSNRERLLARA